MKRLLLPLVCATLLLAGCDSLSSRVHERFATVPPQTRVFEASPRAVFEAGQLAMKRLDFVLTRTAFAQGIITGFSRIQTSDSFRDSRQFKLEMRLHEAGPGRTEVAVLLHEQESTAGRGLGIDTILREHGLYGSYFDALEQALKEKIAPARE